MVVSELQICLKPVMIPVQKGFFQCTQYFFILHAFFVSLFIREMTHNCQNEMSVAFQVTFISCIYDSIICRDLPFCLLKKWNPWYRTAETWSASYLFSFTFGLPRLPFSRLRSSWRTSACARMYLSTVLCDRVLPATGCQQCLREFLPVDQRHSAVAGCCCLC